LLLGPSLPPCPIDRSAKVYPPRQGLPARGGANIAKPKPASPPPLEAAPPLLAFIIPLHSIPPDVAGPSVQASDPYVRPPIIL